MFGCGEGRFCRMLKLHGVEVTGMYPTPALIAAARARDADGAYLEPAANLNRLETVCLSMWVRQPRSIVAFR